MTVVLMRLVGVMMVFAGFGCLATPDNQFGNPLFVGGCIFVSTSFVLEWINESRRG